MFLNSNLNNNLNNSLSMTNYGYINGTSSPSATSSHSSSEELPNFQPLPQNVNAQKAFISNTNFGWMSRSVPEMKHQTQQQPTIYQQQTYPYQQQSQSFQGFPIVPLTLQGWPGYTAMVPIGNTPISVVNAVSPPFNVVTPISTGPYVSNNISLFPHQLIDKVAANKYRWCSTYVFDEDISPTEFKQIRAIKTIVIHQKNNVNEECLKIRCKYVVGNEQVSVRIIDKKGKTPVVELVMFQDTYGELNNLGDDIAGLVDVLQVFPNYSEENKLLKTVRDAADLQQLNRVKDLLEDFLYSFKHSAPFLNPFPHSGKSKSKHSKGTSQDVEFEIKNTSGFNFNQKTLKDVLTEACDNVLSGFENKITVHYEQVLEQLGVLKISFTRSSKQFKITQQFKDELLVCLKKELTEQSVEICAKRSRNKMFFEVAEYLKTMDYDQVLGSKEHLKFITDKGHKKGDVFTMKREQIKGQTTFDLSFRNYESLVHFEPLMEYFKANGVSMDKVDCVACAKNGWLIRCVPVNPSQMNKVFNKYLSTVRESIRNKIHMECQLRSENHEIAEVEVTWKLLYDRRKIVATIKRESKQKASNNKGKRRKKDCIRVVVDDSEE